MWIYLGLVSVLFLGFYNIAKKHGVKENAVIPVLFFSSLSGALVLLPCILISTFCPELTSGTLFEISPLSWTDHLFISVKAIILGCSWILSYFALKHLPISIVQPIRASSSIFTIFGAILIYGETPLLMQWVGIGIILISYFFFSVIGKKEGIIFHQNKWIYYMILATILGATCGLYDKFLVVTKGYDPTTLLAWFSLYLFLFYACITLVLWWPNRSKTTPFTWKWTIPCIGVLLVCADMVYYLAIEDGADLIVLSPLRKSNVLISFFLGAYIFKEKNKRLKALALVGVLIGVIIIVCSKQ